MAPSPTRRSLLAAACALPLLALHGCATGLGGYSLEEAIRRLLTVSSQRAFARLLQENGFFADELTRIALPPQLGGAGAVASSLLRVPAVQRQMLELVNDAAAEAAEAAAPVVYESIRTMTIADALAIVRGGPSAATLYLQERMGTGIVAALFPEVGQAMRLLGSDLVGRVLGAATGIDFAGLQEHVAEAAATSIFRAIGREEAAIRADPAATGDPLLAGVFGLAR